MGQKMMIFVLPSQFSAFVLVAILLITPQGSLSLIRESVNSASYEINDEVIASFLDRQQQQQQKGEGKTNGLGRSLETFKNSQRFGQRCGNNNLCGEGLECTEVNLIMGNRCLPNACLQEQTMAFQDVFDVEQYKANLYNSAGVTEDQVLAALSVAKNQREFLESPEFQSLTQALHENLQPLETLQQISRNCIQSENATVNGTVTYTGLHIEAGLFIDGSMDYLVTKNGDDQQTILRLCLGAEIGAGAEISYIFGFTDTDLTDNMLCASIFADADIVLLVASGVAVGCGLNGVFFYEFTFGGGLGLGIGGGACAAFEEANSTTATTPNQKPNKKS